MSRQTRHDGSYFKRRLAEIGLTQEEAAEKAGITQGEVSKLLADKLPETSRAHVQLVALVSRRRSRAAATQEIRLSRELGKLCATKRDAALVFQLLRTVTRLARVHRRRKSR